MARAAARHILPAAAHGGDSARAAVIHILNAAAHGGDSARAAAIHSLLSPEFTVCTEVVPSGSSATSAA